MRAPRRRPPKASAARGNRSTRRARRRPAAAALALASSTRRLRISSGMRMRGAVCPLVTARAGTGAVGAGGGVGMAVVRCGAGAARRARPPAPRFRARWTRSMGSSGTSSRSSSTRIGCSSVLSRSMTGSPAGRRLGRSRVEARDFGVLDDEQAIEVRSIAVELHCSLFGLGLASSRRPGSGSSFVREWIILRIRRQVRDHASSTGADNSMFSPPGSSSTVIESSGKGGSASSRGIEGLLAQILERIEGGRADAAAHVALREPERFRSDAKDRRTIRALRIHAYSARRRPASRVHLRVPLPGRYQTTAHRPALPPRPGARAFRRARSRPGDAEREGWTLLAGRRRPE